MRSRDSNLFVAKLHIDIDYFYIVDFKIGLKICL